MYEELIKALRCQRFQNKGQCVSGCYKCSEVDGSGRNLTDVLRDSETAITDLTRKLADVTEERDEIAAEFAQTDRMHCLACTNGMKNMHGKHQGCDGNCEHKYGTPDTAEAVVLFFRGGWRGKKEDTDHV